jgi:hypothetical protein
VSQIQVLPQRPSACGLQAQLFAVLQQKSSPWLSAVCLRLRTGTVRQSFEPVQGAICVFHHTVALKATRRRELSCCAQQGARVTEGMEEMTRMGGPSPGEPSSRSVGPPPSPASPSPPPPHPATPQSPLGTGAGQPRRLGQHRARTGEIQPAEARAGGRRLVRRPGALWVAAGARLSPSVAARACRSAGRGAGWSPPRGPTGPPPFPANPPPRARPRKWSQVLETAIRRY